MNPAAEELLSTRALPHPFAAWVVVTMRLAGLCLVAPFFHQGVLPVRLRLGVVGVVSACVVLAAPLRSELQSAADQLPAQLSGPMDGWILLGSEFLLGAALGWGCLLVLGAVRGSCSLICQQIGLSVGETVDPLRDSEEGTLSRFYTLLAVCVFLLLDLHHTLIRAVTESFVWVPPGTMRLELVPTVLGRLALEVGPDLFLAAVTLALPVLLAMLLVSMVHGLLGRALPQAELLILGLPVRLFVGGVVLVVGLPASVGLVHLLFERASSDGRELLRVFGG